MAARAATDAPAVPDEWWTMFGDPVLDDLRAPPRHRQRESEDRARAGRERARDLRREPRRAVADAVDRGCRHAQRKPAIDACRRAEHAEPVEQHLRGRSIASWEIDLWGQLSQASSEAQAGVPGERRRPCRGDGCRPRPRWRRPTS